MNQKHGKQEGSKGNSPRAKNKGEEGLEMVGNVIWGTTEAYTSSAAFKAN